MISSTFLQLIERQVKAQPYKVAIIGSGAAYNYRQLWDEVLRLCQWLTAHSVQRVALALPNCPTWIALDLAAAMEQIVVVPVPHFFSVNQIRHLIRDAEIDHIISDAGFINKYADSFGLQTGERFNSLNENLQISSLEPGGTQQFKGENVASETGLFKILKISYTSGTTGEPKGVLISQEAVNRTVNSLVQTMGASAAERHLSVLPYSLLLENIVGIYAVLAAGGCCVALELTSLGISGSSKVDWPKFAARMLSVKPGSMITVPALLQGLVFCVNNLGLDIASLKYVAVGGAPVSKQLLDQARELGLPIFQGYGMTECASVVCLNKPGQDQTGSVGMPLPHLSIRIDDNGEIIVRDADFVGYTNQPERPSIKEWATGDLGYFDDSGFLYVSARKSSAYSTAYGRNVAPEWVESELDAEAVIAQSAVFGEGQRHNISVLVPIMPAIDNAQLARSVEKVNQRLPDYAQISAWTRAEAAFDISNGQRSPAGALRREKIYADYYDTIEQLFIETQV